MLEHVRAMPLFAQFPPEELEMLLQQSHVIELPAGEFLFYDGDAPTGFYVILDGELEITKTIGGQTVILANQEPGAFVGEIGFLTGQRRNASAQARGDTRLLEFDANLVDTMSMSSSMARLLHATMAQRLRDTEAQIRQTEKLSALGKLAAGLAHELNNPASANVRAARQIPAMLVQTQRHAFAVPYLGLNEEQMNLISELSQRIITQPAPPPLEAMRLADLENAMIDWLEEHGIPDSWQIAPSLAAEGIGLDTLDMLEEIIPGDALAGVLQWLDATLNLVGLARTVATSATRISEMIQAVKSYTYMDEAPLQYVDLHEGLENTLTVLSNRLKRVTVEREFDRTCPRLNVYASELNQVWTKVIENALDAMGDRGTLTIRTELGESFVRITISDTGRGIPPDVQSRIFEPFFSTKPMGTGLGLDIARRIVLDKHHGDIQFTSQPGKTCFIITLPLTQGG